MDIPSIGAALPLPRTPKTTAAPAASEARTPGPTQTYEIRFEVKVAVELGIRIQLSRTGEAPAAVGETKDPESTEALSRRDMRKALRHLDKSVRKELRSFAHGLDDDSRDAVKGLAKQFRRELRAALRANYSGDTRDPEAMVAAVDQAYQNLVQGLEEVAASATVEHEHDHPRGMARAFLAQLDSGIRKGIQAAFESGALGKEDRKAIKDLTKAFHHQLRDAFRSARSEDGMDRNQFLTGVGDALRQLADGLDQLVDADETGTTPETPGSVEGYPSTPSLPEPRAEFVQYA